MAAAMSGATGPELDPRSVNLFAGCLYTLLLAGALLWLWWRSAFATLPQQALGEHGIWVAAGSGLLVGLLLAGGLRLAARHWPQLAAIERRVARLLGPMGESQILWLSLLAAVAEEAFFRLAVQDQFGLPITVALYAAVNTGPGFWAWLPVAGVFGLCFGLLVEAGAGLLAATSAHAVVNYLSLRRILPS